MFLRKKIFLIAKFFIQMLIEGKLIAAIAKNSESSCLFK